jgi:uncharacterized membrane protein
MDESLASEPAPDRPRSATVIAWLWIVFAVAGLLSSVKDFFTARRFAAARMGADDDPRASDLMDKFAALVGGTPLELLVAAVFAVVVIAGAIGLLKLRSWGRRTLVGVTWLALIGNLIAQPILIWQMGEFMSFGNDGFSVFYVMLILIGLLQLTFTVAVCGLILRSLHGSVIRDAISAAAGSDSKLDRAGA